MLRLAVIAALTAAPLAFAQDAQTPAATPAPEGAAPAPAEATAPTPATPETPAAPNADDKNARGCDRSGGHCEGQGWGAHGGWGKGNGGWRNWQSDPWFAAIEVGSVFGQGLNAQVSFRPWGGFSLGVGALGFGDRTSLDRFRSTGSGDDSARGRGFLQGGVKQGYYLAVTRYASWGRGGPFAGVKLGVADAFLKTNDGTPDATFWGMFVSPEVGLQWFPFQRAVFIRPAVGVSAVVGRFNGSANAPVPPFLIPNASLSLGAAL